MIAKAITIWRNKEHAEKTVGKTIEEVGQADNKTTALLSWQL